MALPTSLLRKIELSKKSGTLNLRGEELKTLPEEVYNRSTQDNWFDTVDLLQLIVSHNELQSLPEDIGILYELKLIDVSHNQLTQLPAELFSISELRSIDISYNRFISLPEGLNLMSTLVSLSCGGNQMEAFADGFGREAFQLTKLEAQENQLTTLPITLKNATALALLNLENNKFERFSGAVLPGFESLTELNLDNNRLQELPKELKHLTQLKILRARRNQLTSVPDEISGCASLLELYLGYNRIKSLTDSIGLSLSWLQGALKQLSILDLNTNGLKTFPGPPCRGMKLQTLDLANNDLTGLPGEVGLITTLRRLPLDGNPLRTIRRDLAMGPVSKLLDSLRKKLPIEDPDLEPQPFSGRIMITGDPLTQIKNLLQSYVMNQNPGELDLSKMALKEIPTDIWMHIAFVSRLVLDDNQALDPCLNAFRRLCVQLGEFDGRPLAEADRLRALSMQNCQLQLWPLPVDDGSLPSMKELDLSRNKQMPIPDNAFISCYQSLTVLKLNGVLSVPSLPEDSFISLRCLESVSLSMTRLKTFPMEFIAMATLTHIDVSQNAIEEIPEEITQLTKLEYLDVSNNSILALPPRIGFMDPVLKTFKVEGTVVPLSLVVYSADAGNILKTVRRSVLSKGTVQLLEYLRERAPAQ